jgi:hypothetical protein
LRSRFDNFGSLGDLFPETEIKCRIRGCKNTFHISGDEAMHNLAKGVSSRPDKMCDKCFQLFQTLQDKEIPCAKPGCAGTWNWNRFQQLESHAAGYGDTPPKGFCAACREEIREGGDLQQPCRLRGCKNTWVWSKRMQMQSGGGKPPRRLCEECFQTLKTLEDRELPCRVKGCDNKLVWNKYLQLEHLHTGKSLDNPPRRMCETCLAAFQGLENIVEPCKVNGCKGTWVYGAFEQLDRLIASKKAGDEAEKPSRMCKDCFDFYNSATDRKVACRNRGCDKTWLFTRSMQLGFRKKAAENQTPSRVCDDCMNRLKSLQPIEEPCQVQGCAGTWSYRAEEQLHDQLLGRKAPRKNCKACQEFLASHEAIDIACSRCEKVFSWSSQEQLLCSLEVFDKPELCADCVQKEMAEIRPPEAKPIPKPDKYTIKIPLGGAWNENSLIRERPPHTGKELISRMEEAAVRIVCFGDDLTFCGSELSKSWPALLEKRLQERYGQELGRVAVANAGIQGCKTKLGVQRFARDVLPFEPHLLIVSFVFSDIDGQHLERLTKTTMAEKLEKLSEDFEELLENLKKLPPYCRSLYWLPNPIFPQKNGLFAADWRENGQIDEEARGFFEAWLRQLRQRCQAAKLPLLDGRALFEIGGIRSALRWMENWFQPNEIGLNNFTSWFEDMIHGENLLQGAQEE